MADLTNEDCPKRRPKFNPDELEAFVDAVNFYQDTICAKFSDCVTNNKKKAAWASVTASVNVVSKVRRSVDEIRRKWRDWSSVIKNKEQRRRKAQKKNGGSHFIALTPLEEKVIAIIGETAIEGVTGGVTTANDTSAAADTSGSGTESAGAEGMPDECSTVSNKFPITSLRATRPTGSGTMQLTERSRSRSRSFGPITIHRSTTGVKRAKTSHNATLSTEASYDDTDSTHQLAQLETARLQVEQERLAVEQRRLAVEQRRLAVEEKKLQLLQTLISQVTNDKVTGTQQLVNQSLFAL